MAFFGLVIYQQFGTNPISDSDRFLFFFFSGDFCSQCQKSWFFSNASWFWLHSMDWFCWENFHRKPWFLPWNILGFSCQFSPKPIHWFTDWIVVCPPAIPAMQWIDADFIPTKTTQNQWEILQDPIDGGTFVPYVWPYFVVIFTYIGLKNRPYIGLIYGIGTSILGSWNSHWQNTCICLASPHVWWFKPHLLASEAPNWLG